MREMSKIAICNVSGFGREFPEFLIELEKKVGPVEKFTFDSNVSQSELADTLKGFTYVILGTHPDFKEEFFEKNQDVKLIARHGLGFNNIDIEAAKKHNVFVTKESNVIEQDAVAEHAVALLHAVSKNLVIANQMVHDNEWKVSRQRCMGYQIRNKVTGIIGYGNIGRRVGEIMKYGYKNRIVAYDPYLPEEKATEYGIELMSLEQVFEQADFISIHCNLTTQNQKMINADVLKHAKPSLILINCARGGLVDEQAIAQAVSSQQIFGYGADATANEPIEMDNPLLKLDHVILSPHVGVYNYTCTENMNRKVMEDIYLMEKGQRPKEIINGL
ncbi:MAG: NAD(P)-dependent oxidoreductase [Floccifex sp.]